MPQFDAKFNQMQEVLAINLGVKFPLFLKVRYI